MLPFYPVFLGGMTLVVLAADAFSFLVAWEVMSLASWALVMAHHRSAENAAAGYIYLLMAAFGAVALLLAFGLLAGPDGTYSFAAMRESSRSPVLTSIILALALIGTGSKAGLVPLHAWLPLAHPAAPSHVSALMSGVMTKVAVYGFIRIAFDLVGPVQWWWSMVVLALAGVTAAMGVLYALMQHDLKRLLASQGARLIGAYDSVVAFGQARALLVWQRIVMPDGSSLQIDNLPATDAAGYAGLEDEVDYHTWQLLKGVVLSTLLGVGTELTLGSGDSDLVRALRLSTQQSINQAGQRITEKNLNIQPTITVRPGWPLRVIVHKDLVLKPYRA